MATPGHIVISSNFERRSPLPLDPSLIRDDIADRDAIPSYQRYPNMEITLLNTNETYKLIVGTSSADPMDNNNWVQQYNNESYWLESAGVYGYILNPVPGVKELFLQEDGGGLTMLTIRNNNDVDNYVGAVLQLKGSGADFTNNLYFGKYGESFYIPSWAGNAVLATDRNLVFGAIGDTSYIMFQAGGGYSTPIDVLQLQHNGRLQSQVVDYENLVTGDNDFTNKKYVDNLASGITLAIEWEFSDIIVDADPGTGKFQFNASTMVATDTIYVNDYSTSGVDMSTIISNLEIGDVLYLQNRTDSSVAGLFTIAALPVDDVGYWKIPVTYESDSGNQFVDGVQSVWIISSGTSTAVVDEKVKSTAADDTAGYLYNKLIEGVGVTIDLQNPGLTETLLISTPQAHDQNTDYQIVYEETATVSFYLGGNSGAYVLRTQDNRVNIDFDANATAYFDVIQVIANGFYHLNYITIFEGATQIYASAISAQVIDTLSGLDYGYKLTHPVLLTNGVSYRFEFMHDGPANSTIPSSLTLKGNYIEGGTFTFVPNYVLTYTDETGTPITRTDVAIINTLRSSNEAGIIVDTGNIVAYGNGFTYNGYQVYHEGNLPIGLTQPDIYQLYQPDKTNPFVYTDNSGTLHIDGNIVQNGSAYETHAEQIYTKKDLIITRDGAVAGLAAGEYSGIQAHLYDGVTDGQLVFDNGGVARVGDIGNLQPLATREETPTDGDFAQWNAVQQRFITVANTSSPWTINGSDIYYNTGNVGIGTTSPNVRFEVLSGVSNNEIARFGGTVSDRGLRISSQLVGGTNEAGYDINANGVGGIAELSLSTAGTSRVLIDSDGNVGIGTNSPSGKLDVRNGNVVFKSPTGISRFSFAGGGDNSANGIQRVFDKDGNVTIKLDSSGNSYLNGGNVGIGTASPDYKLEVGKSDISGYVTHVNNTGTTAGRNGLLITTGSTDTGSFPLWVRSNAGSTTGLLVRSDGNVGIGTSTPNHELSIFHSSDPTIQLINSTTGQGVGDGFTIGLDNSNNGTIIVREDANLNIYTNSLQRATILSNGNVGIGTDNPISKLTVFENKAGYVAAQFENNNSAGNGILVKGGQGTGSYIADFRQADNTIKVRIDTNGNVGIGTESPDTLLHLVKDSNSNQLKLERTGTSTGIAHLAALVGGLIIASDNAGAYGTPRMYVGTSGTYNGRVGIGTTTPSQVLTVNGAGIATDWLLSSDKRFKDNIEVFSSLDKLLLLNPVSFKWNTLSKKYGAYKEGVDFGLIAQDVEKIIPEVVNTDSKGYKSIGYSKLSTLAIGGIQELYNKTNENNKQLRTRVTDLEEENIKLSERLNKLESIILRNR